MVNSNQEAVESQVSANDYVITVDFERSFKTEELRKNESEEALFSDKKKD